MSSQAKFSGGLPEWVRDFCLESDHDEQSLKEFYKRFSSTYDETLLGAGYQVPMVTCKAFDKALYTIKDSENVKKTPILDIGAGTGLMGSLLKDLGYLDIHAIDCSIDMLEKAKEKNIYNKIMSACIDERKNEEIQDGAYGALVSSGAISGPQIQARAFDEMIRWLKKDGIFCFTIRKNDVMGNTNLGYQEKFQDFEETGKWKLISRDVVDYIKNPGDNEDVFQKAFLYMLDLKHGLCAIQRHLRPFNPLN